MGIGVLLLSGLSTRAAWRISTLATFDKTVGSLCLVGPAKGTNHELYAAASGGGSNDLDTIFQMTPNGTPSARRECQ